LIDSRVLSKWLISVDSLREPGRRGCERCLGRAEGVAEEVEEGVGEEMGGMKPPPVDMCVD
jgi:hypothetical protein